MLKSLPDVLRSIWSKSANDNSSHVAGRKRKLEETEWDNDPDCQIIKVEKKRKTESLSQIKEVKARTDIIEINYWDIKESKKPERKQKPPGLYSRFSQDVQTRSQVWNIFNIPSKMADWIRLKHRPFSEQFSTSKVTTDNITKEMRRNGASNRIPIENGSEDSDSFPQIPKVHNRPGHLSHSRGIVNGEHREYSHSSRLSDRASSDISNLRPLKNSTSSMCIRLNEKEEYQKLLKMQMIHSRLHSSNSLCPQSPLVESDRLSVSSNNSSNDVSLLGTSQCLSQFKHTSHNPPSIPHYKTTPTKVSTSSSLFASSTSTYSQRLKTNDLMPPRALLSLIARQKHRASIKDRTPKEMNPSQPLEEVQQTAVVSDDDDVLIVESDEDEARKTAATPSKDREDNSQKKESSKSFGKPNRLEFLDSVYTRDGYLKELNKSRLMYSEQWKRQVEEQEMKAKAYEEKRRAQGSELERRLKHQMRIFEQEPEVSEEIFIEEEEEVEEVLPDLTDSMMQVIRAAMRPSPPGEVLSDGYALKITRKDLATLGGLNWLNDEIINFYMNMLIDRGKQDDMPNVYAFNTFFYPKIMSGGHAAVKRWTKKVDIFAMHYILIPVHLGMHWCLCVVNMKDKVITYYDSMGARNQECLVAVLKYINDESVAKKQTPINESEWKLVTAKKQNEERGVRYTQKDNPQQMNGGDCGMFACKYAEYITRGKEISFTQNDMPYFRLRMVYEIVTKKLLQ